MDSSNNYSTSIIPGELNQDRLEVIECENDFVVLAIADGAGDTKQGGFAAECALESVNNFSTNLPTKINRIVFENIHKYALELLNNHEYNQDKKALAAYTTAFITPESELMVCSMGDVMFSVFREGKCEFQTTEFVRKDHWITKGLMLDYDEEGFNDIVVEEFDLEQDDLIIGASDGLWDNIRPEELENRLNFEDSTDGLLKQLGEIPHDRKGYQDDRAIIVYSKL